MSPSDINPLFASSWPGLKLGMEVFFTDSNAEQISQWQYKTGALISPLTMARFANVILNKAPEMLAVFPTATQSIEQLREDFPVIKGDVEHLSILAQAQGIVATLWILQILYEHADLFSNDNQILYEHADLFSNDNPPRSTHALQIPGSPPGLHDEGSGLFLRAAFQFEIKEAPPAEENLIIEKNVFDHIIQSLITHAQLEPSATQEESIHHVQSLNSSTRIQRIDTLDASFSTFQNLWKKIELHQVSLENNPLPKKTTSPRI